MVHSACSPRTRFDASFVEEFGWMVAFRVEGEFSRKVGHRDDVVMLIYSVLMQKENEKSAPDGIGWSWKLFTMSC